MQQKPLFMALQTQPQVWVIYFLKPPIRVHGFLFSIQDWTLVNEEQQ